MYRVPVRLLISLVLVATLWLPSGAVPEGSILSVEGDKIVINRGGAEEVRGGVHCYVYRNGNPIAELEVQSVGQYSSLARVVRTYEGAAVQVGDVVSGQPIPFEQLALEKQQRTAVVRVAPTQDQIREGLERLKGRYREAFERRTRSEEFRTVAKGRSYDEIANPGMGLWEIYSAYDLVVTSFDPQGNFVGDPATLVYAAAGPVISNNMSAEVYDSVDNKVEIEVTYWDSQLAEAYGNYVAAKEGGGDQQKMLQIKTSLLAQKGVDRNEVFEVRIRNTGKTVAQVSPFAWHCFLGGSDGVRVAPERSDSILDRALNPGEEVTGNVYFPKRQGSGVTLIFEDIFGDRAEMGFR